MHLSRNYIFGRSTMVKASCHFQVSTKVSFAWLRGRTLLRNLPYKDDLKSEGLFPTIIINIDKGPSWLFSISQNVFWWNKGVDSNCKSALCSDNLSPRQAHYLRCPKSGPRGSLPTIPFPPPQDQVGEWSNLSQNS